MNWKEFIGMHMSVLLVTAFFTTEVWTWCGLVTYRESPANVPKK
jgi:hypothetical protein